MHSKVTALYSCRTMPGQLLGRAMGHDNHVS